MLARQSFKAGSSAAYAVPSVATGGKMRVPSFAMSSLAMMRGRRKKKRLPMNTIINFVPQQEAWVVERFGKFHSVLDPGLAILVPFIDNISYVQSLKEEVLEIPAQSGITSDNVTLNLDGVLYFKIDDPYVASYGVENAENAVAQLAMTTMRSEIGKLPLDSIFKERGSLNVNIVSAINEAAKAWGLVCLRCEIRDIALPDSVVEDMQLQVSAERKKRAAILESEGVRTAAVNKAEGLKAAAVLESEAINIKQTNEAEGEASAIVARASATAKAIEIVANASTSPGAEGAIRMKIAQEYIAAFGKIAKEGNTLLLPSNASDPAGMIAQALAVYKANTGDLRSGEHSESLEEKTKGT